MHDRHGGNWYISKEEFVMLQTVVEKLVESPDLLKQVREGNASLAGISETEKAAILDVFEEDSQENTVLGICYWK